MATINTALNAPTNNNNNQPILRILSVKNTELKVGLTGVKSPDSSGRKA